MSAWLDSMVSLIASVLERFGVITEDRFRTTMDIAWPRIVTGFSMMSKQTADLAMVGIAIGTAGTAGLAFAFAYWRLVSMLGIGLASGTVSLVSQNYGGDEIDRASLVIKQSILISVGLALPIMGLFVWFAEPLISLLGAQAESIHHGRQYLVFVAPAVLFELFNLIASRTYTGVGDTYTEMVARAGGAGLNIVFSGIFIFGLGLGAAGAGLGTMLASGIVAVVLGWGMVGRTYGALGMEPSPVPVSRHGPWFDAELGGHLIEISTPEIGRRLVSGIFLFPLLGIASTFGPVIVTALEVSRRVRRLITSINWGLGLASSSLVGQHLGADEEREAGQYGASIIRLAVAFHLGAAALIIVLSIPIADVFVSGTNEVVQTAEFVVVGAISSVGFALDGTSTGALVGAGDTRWPFVSSLIGRYVFALPVAIVGLITPLGVVGLYLAILLETFVPGGINFLLFRSGRWKQVSRRYRSTSEAG